MKLRVRLVGVACLLSFLLLFHGVASAIDVHDTKLLTEPAVSQTHIAFVYAGDLWVAGLDGENVRRLTSDEGVESRPAFSPDGRQIAFSAQYEGNTDVYIMPVEGGIPTRLTWHPGPDLVQGFTADGSAVLFTSPRTVFTTRFTQLFTVAAGGGVEEPLPIPNAARASYSPDGRRVAYNPLGPAFLQWKRYRGGRVSQVWLYDVSTHAVEKVPQPETRANDADPFWLGDRVYFRSDRDGEFNLYSFDPASGTIEQLTRHADFPVLHASGGGGRIVYEQGGHLHLFDPATQSSTRLRVGVAADLPETRPRFVKGSRYIRHAALSPSGARAAFEFRGEIVTVPAEKGDVRNLTATTGTHERSPAWSPDGRWIAYFSDAGGEYALHVTPQDGKGEVRTFPLNGTGFYDRPVWSPDSRRIAYSDNSWTLYWIDVATGRSTRVASEYLYGPASLRTMRYVWSPDSTWLAYTLNTQAYIQAVYAYSTAQDKSYPITDGLSEVSEPVFDRSGKYLYFFGSTDAGPVKDWFAMSSADMRATRSIYLAVLRRDLPSPLARESDEEKGSAVEDADREDETEEEKPDATITIGGQDRRSPTGPRPASPARSANRAGAVPFSIDLDGLAYRILDLPIPAGDYSNLQGGSNGQIYYLKASEGKRSLQRFDLASRRNETVLPDATDYVISADARRILYRSGSTWFIVPATGRREPGQGRLRTEAIEVRVEPRAEWGQMFEEAWRINRDYFYDPGMHGVDWPAMREKYAAFLPHVASRPDLNRVIQWMASELAVGHHRVDGGDTFRERTTVPGGLLGADYEIQNGRYRFRKVFGGLNWNPELRSPLTEPGVNVTAGEYLLAVQGRDLRPPANLYSLFENTAGKIIEITVGPSADGQGSRTVSVVPIENENALRNRDWVEGNLRKVDAATGGRVAYVYVPNTTTLGHTYFKRYFYPQAHKDAIIIDERFNGGGQVADYYIDILRRPHTSYWAMRYGADLKTPTASIQGPKVMIIDETAGSGGDLLPWMFRKFEMGVLVGQRTWGGLVGVLGFPVLMDGGIVTAPNLAIWTEDGWVVENEGVPPDVEVEQTPADVIAGRDPQLEQAIEIVLKQLDESPPAAPQRPAYPRR